MNHEILKIENPSFEISDIEFQSFKSGYNLHGKIFYSKKFSYKKVIHITFLHGAIDYHLRYRYLFDFLFKKFPHQLIVSTFDYLGHGYSGGNRAYVEDFDIFCKDFLSFQLQVKNFFELKKWKHVQNYIIAHSMGGLIALKTLLEFEQNLHLDYQGLILSNPCIRPQLRLPSSLVDIVASGQKNLGKIRLPLIYNSSDLCSDPLLANAFDSDILISKFITFKMAWEVYMASKGIRSLSYYLKIPSLFLLSGDDRVVDSNATEIFAKGMRKDLVTIKSYKKSRHELLCETNREQVYADLGYWLYNIFLRKS